MLEKLDIKVERESALVVINERKLKVDIKKWEDYNFAVLHGKPIINYDYKN